MATIILNQKINDYESWKAAYDADHSKRISMGIEEVAVGKKRGRSDMAYMVWHLHDGSPILNMLSDPALQRAMQDTGIIKQHAMIILK